MVVCHEFGGVWITIPLFLLFFVWCLNIITSLLASEKQSEQIQLLQDSLILYHIFFHQLEHITVFQLHLLSHSLQMSDADTVSFPGAPSPFLHRAMRQNTPALPLSSNI